MDRQLDESRRTSLEQEHADLETVQAELPGWFIWATWHCGNRTWHAVPNFRGHDGLAAHHLARSAPGRVTADTREALIRKCGEVSPA